MGKIFPRSDVMTTIGCSSNCIYQQDGNCTLDDVTINTVSMSADCVFFQEKTTPQQLGKRKA